MNVKLIRMWSGEDVIADLVEQKEDSIVVVNPIVAVPTGQQGQIGFAPWSPLLKAKGVELEITNDYVVYISETQPEVETEYQNMFSVIQSPNKKLIV